MGLKSGKGRRGLVTLALLCALAGILTSCSCLKMERSVNRISPPQPLELPGNVTFTSVGTVNATFAPIVNHVDLFPAGFKIEAPGLVAYIDPILVDDPKPADFIFITHPHGDHLWLPDIAKLATEKTVIFAPKTAIDQLKGYQVKLVRPGDKVDLGSISFETFPSYNAKAIFHPKKDEYVGYVFTIGGSRVYLAGDTDFVPELRAIKGVDVAMVPFDGGTAMGPKEAAALINSIHPRIVVPIHYTPGTKNLATYLGLIDKDIEVRNLETN